MAMPPIESPKSNAPRMEWLMGQTTHFQWRRTEEKARRGEAVAVSRFQWYSPSLCSHQSVKKLHHVVSQVDSVEVKRAKRSGSRDGVD